MGYSIKTRLAAMLVCLAPVSATAQQAQSSGLQSALDQAELCERQSTALAELSLSGEIELAVEDFIMSFMTCASAIADLAAYNGASGTGRELSLSLANVRARYYTGYSMLVVVNFGSDNTDLTTPLACSLMRLARDEASNLSSRMSEDFSLADITQQAATQYCNPDTKTMSWSEIYQEIYEIASGSGYPGVAAKFKPLL